MAQKSAGQGQPEVPKQIVETFLTELGNSGVSADMVARLRKVLLDEMTFTEGAIREALFPIIEDL